MKTFLWAVTGLAMLLISGCATTRLADTDSIQGTWTGQEWRAGQDHKGWLNLTGRELEFRAADGKEWYRGTFTLQENTSPKQMLVTITRSPVAPNVGQKFGALYELEIGSDGHDRLIITVNPPGNPQMPDGLGDRHARQIIFTRN